MKNTSIKYKIRLLILIATLMIGNLGITIESDNSYTSAIENEIEYIYINVKPGDSIWNLVANNLEEISVTSNLQFRDIVDIVTDLNGGNNLKPGQVIKLPRNI